MTNTLPNNKTSDQKTRHHHPRPIKVWQDGSHGQGEVQINIVPLIDVIFCILTFFILGAVGLSRQQAIGLDLPKAASGTPQMREMLVVSLDSFGQLYVEKQLVTPNQLEEAIKNYHQFNPTGMMVLHASKDASYSEVVQVLDMLKKVGGDRVALATLPGEGGSFNQTTPNSNPFPSGTNLPGGTYNYGQQQSPSSLPEGFGGNPSIPNVPSAPGSAPQTN
ncbi:Biopolymer transport protein ExbD/TolR [Gloeothece citriformis PCC 7424]|uniref:Biopolymer transport protein ExbD/TolR n=1 Tax=Gloeothece citriformis (strain PCC 7424) TaxID=65393 RepID=B7KEY6_GLOC7|nr:biopolymer transporter ExbD [Gloeothece citriformis]ACK70442.1 Biopolymer transport protein ExbD/TolR [Gloeothece citriformis PCC 7424]